MLTLNSLNADKHLKVLLAIGFAEKALPVWEREYPEDMRPREAIEAAKEWLSNPSEETAAHAAEAAAHAAYAAAHAAARAADAAYAAAHAAYAAAHAAGAAAGAAAAAEALRADEESLIHEVILESLEWILQYKIQNEQSFAEPEIILNYLDEEQKPTFLFNLDVLTPFEQSP